jgi:hypothetical protein
MVSGLVWRLGGGGWGQAPTQFLAEEVTAPSPPYPTLKDV